jgi:hypothetical protein
VKTDGKVVPLRRPADGAVRSEPDLANLARLIAAYAPHDGSFEMRIAGLHANRFSRTNTECVHTLRLPPAARWRSAPCAAMHNEVYGVPAGSPSIQERNAVYVAPMDVSIVNAATRLMECLAQPGDVDTRPTCDR